MGSCTDFNKCTQSKFSLYNVLVVLVSFFLNISHASKMPKRREGLVRLTCESLIELVRKNPGIYDAKSNLSHGFCLH